MIQSNNNLKQQLERECQWKQLLNQESPFHDPDSSFIFIFKPENVRDEELFEAERKDLAARFDDFVSSWAQRELTNPSSYCDFGKFCSSMMETFPEKIAVFWVDSEGNGQISRAWKDQWGYDKLHAPDDKQEALEKLVFGDKQEVLSNLRSKEDAEKRIRLSYFKTAFPELFDERADAVSQYYNSAREWWNIHWNCEHSSWEKIKRLQFRYTENGSKSWLKSVLGCYWETLSEPALKDLKETHGKLALKFKRFSDSHMEDIVTIANYMSNDELRSEGESMKNAVIEAKKAVDTHSIETFRTDLSFENHEAEVQKIFAKKVSGPIEELKKSFDKNKLSEDHVSYEVTKQSILSKREEQKRLEEQRKEKVREAELARVKAAQLAEKKKRKECLENFMTMLRDSGHGHGHKDREGDEKLWYETEELAAADALKLAKKDNRLLKPYRVTLYTEMDQPVDGWFLTTAVSSKEAA